MSASKLSALIVHPLPRPDLTYRLRSPESPERRLAAVAGDVQLPGLPHEDGGRGRQQHRPAVLREQPVLHLRAAAARHEVRT